MRWWSRRSARLLGARIRVLSHREVIRTRDTLIKRQVLFLGAIDPPECLSYTPQMARKLLTELLTNRQSTLIKPLQP